MSSTLLTNSASPPTIAKSLAQAVMMALRVSFGLSFESMKSMTTLRPGDAAALVDHLGPGLHGVDRLLEQARLHGGVDVGDHRDADLGVGDADVVGLGRGALRAGDRDGRTDQCDDGDRDRQYP